MNTDTKRIAIITNSIQGGGAERCAADLSIYFDKCGYRVFFFTDLSIKQDYEYAGTLVNLSYIIDVSKYRDEKEAWINKVQEIELLKAKYQIDISISFMQFANYINILSKGRDRVILTTHSVNSIYAKMENSVFWSEHTFQELYQYADLITFPSEYCRSDWLKHYGDKNNITRTVYNPVHFMNYDKAQKKENLILAIGRMHSIKRQWHLIKAFKIVQEVYPDYKLIILGDGDLRAKLESLITEFGLQGQVEMPGNVTNVSEYLNRAQIMIMSSYCEAMSCSVLEALSAGVPVISCDSPGGIREEIGVDSNIECIENPIQGKCGIITPFIKENSMKEFSKEEIIFANEIIHLIRDDNLRDELSGKARNAVDAFSIEKIGKIWTDEILSINSDRQIDAVKFEVDKKKSLNSFVLKKEQAMDMYASYYKLLEKWMVLHEKGIKISSYFEKKNWHNVIIYGMGKMASHLIHDLQGSDIRIVCAIDKKAANMYEDFPIVSEKDEIPEADCVVVTPIYDFICIQAKLMPKTDIPIISLMDVLNYEEEISYYNRHRG